jgi:hypothetical protein
MKNTHKLRKRNNKKFSKNNRKGGRVFGYPTNPFKAVANRTGMRKSRDQITKENMIFGMAPVKDYHSIVANKMIPFQENIKTIDDLMHDEMNELQGLVPQCVRECLIATQSKDPDSVEFAKKLNPLSLCSICSIPPYEISICQDVEEKRKTIEAYLSVIKELVNKYEDNLALLGKTDEESMDE